VKTLNRLKTTMSDHEFEVKDRQRSDLPDFLKKRQNIVEPGQVYQSTTFNRIVHVDTINTHTTPDKMIIIITDDSRTFSTSAVITDSGPDVTISAIWSYWCKPYGFPEVISFKQGKVQTSKLEKLINDLAPLEQRVSCRSRKDAFNTEIEQQWQQNQHEISEEEFVHTLNFLCDLQKPGNEKHVGNTTRAFNDNYEDLPKVNEDAEDGDELESDFEDLGHIGNYQPTNSRKRKSVSLCRHKLQERAGYRSRRGKQPANQRLRIENLEGKEADDEWAQLRLMEKFLEQQRLELLRQGAPDSDDEDWDGSQGPDEIKDYLDEEEDDSLENVEEAEAEWAQLRKMERFLEQQKLELLKQGAPEPDDEEWDGHHWPEEKESGLDEEEDDSLENEDLAFITSVLDSFSRPKSKSTKLNESGCAILTPEGTPMQAKAKPMTPQKFNQNSMIKNSATEKFNCFPTIQEEGAGEFSEEEDTLSEIDPEEFEFETQSEVDTEETGNETPFQGIYSISENRGQAFSAWQPYIPPELAFLNSSARSWWSASSPQRTHHWSLPSPGSHRSIVQIQQSDKLQYQ
jgi:hypothetical protein